MHRRSVASARSADILAGEPRLEFRDIGNWPYCPAAFGRQNVQQPRLVEMDMGLDQSAADKLPACIENLGLRVDLRPRPQRSSNSPRRHRRAHPPAGPEAARCERSGPSRALRLALPVHDRRTGPGPDAGTQALIGIGCRIGDRARIAQSRGAVFNHALRVFSSLPGGMEFCVVIRQTWLI